MFDAAFEICCATYPLQYNFLPLTIWRMKVQPHTRKTIAYALYCFYYPTSMVRWPIPVKQIQVNENKFKLTKTHPRKRKHFPENGNNSQKTKTTPRKRKQIQVNENKFKLTKTHPRKQNQIQLNENNSQKAKTNST